jgi:hypothetical protein
MCHVIVVGAGLGLLYSLGLTENLTGLIWYICELDTQLSAVARLRELALQEPEHAAAPADTHGSGGASTKAAATVPDDWPSKVGGMQTEYPEHGLGSFTLVFPGALRCMFVRVFVCMNPCEGGLSTLFLRAMS